MPRHNGHVTFSACGKYRYVLGGDLGPEEPLLRRAVTNPRTILWVLHNPSEADDRDDDMTLGTIVVFSEMWGFERILVGNLSAYIAKMPKDMARAKKHGVDVVGPDNDRHLREMIATVRASPGGGRVMAGWGAGGDPERAKAIHALAGEMYCLRQNKGGSPVHPLYQPHRLVPYIWPGMSDV